mmetsp:Transcript_1277/g.3011  ORF Transcript_1277/g.3011 Transcript_1277/m.3011 type:complete len:399 (-) Transcript_1277:1901-3097(-)
MISTVHEQQNDTTAGTSFKEEILNAASKPPLLTASTIAIQANARPLPVSEHVIPSICKATSVKLDPSPRDVTDDVFFTPTKQRSANEVLTETSNDELAAVSEEKVTMTLIQLVLAHTEIPGLRDSEITYMQFQTSAEVLMVKTVDHDTITENLCVIIQYLLRAIASGCTGQKMTRIVSVLKGIKMKSFEGARGGDTRKDVGLFFAAVSLIPQGTPNASLVKKLLFGILFEHLKSNSECLKEIGRMTLQMVLLSECNSNATNASSALELLFTATHVQQIPVILGGIKTIISCAEKLQNDAPGKIVAYLNTLGSKVTASERKEVTELMDGRKAATGKFDWKANTKALVDSVVSNGGVFKRNNKMDNHRQGATQTQTKCQSFNRPKLKQSSFRTSHGLSRR